MQTYTIADLEDLYGPEWRKSVFSGYPNVPITKPVIFNFTDFNESTKNIYRQILNIIASNNVGDYQVWATGSRIDGRWMTEQEAEVFYTEYKSPVNYSDYDFITTAKNIPTTETFNNTVSGLGKSVVGVQQGSSIRKVLITT